MVGIRQTLMLQVRKPIRVDVVGLGEMESLSKQVHRADKVARRSPDGIRNGYCSIVTRRQHEPIEQILQTDLVANDQIGTAAVVLLNLGDGVLLDRHKLTEFSSLNGNECSHHFGGTGHGKTLLSPDISQDMPRIGVE